MLGGGARFDVELLVAHRVGDLESCFATLLLPEEIPHAAKSQISTRNLKAVVGVDENPQALVSLFTNVTEQYAVRRLGTSSDAAAQLMQLRETEPLGMFDQHHRRIRNVDTHLDDGR